MKQDLNSTATKYRFKKNSRVFPADKITPVGIYLHLRDNYPNPVLFESSEYNSRENSKTFICFDVLGSIEIRENKIKTKINARETRSTVAFKEVKEVLQQFISSFEIESAAHKEMDGLYGFMSYNAIQYFEDITLKKNFALTIPDLFYSFYRFVLVIDHYSGTAELSEYVPEGLDSQIERVVQELNALSCTHYDFSLSGTEKSGCTDHEFLERVKMAKENCYRGDVFQLVLSRRFTQQFQGDDFNVYRALRSLNPSPYLFYYDCGDFHLMGSSPEAQLKITNGTAEIHPIAGTFKRAGIKAEDEALVELLKNDRKENAEHIMLVDLARNDLSKYCSDVKVESLREIQLYSHVIHMVSKVTGKLSRADGLNLIGSSFPAGTLTGAPKYRAMELIDEYENLSRSFYGGCIGFLGFNGDFNSAIMIRTLLSQNNTLVYQAGAGIVADSIAENEKNEVDNKLGAVRKAIALASTFKN